MKILKEKLNILDNRIIKDIRQPQKEVENISRTNQPVLGDWYTFREKLEFVEVQNGAGFRYGRVQFIDNTIDPAKYLSVGDYIRYRQGGEYKYAYVTEFIGNEIEIYGGSQYVLASAEITEFGKGVSRLPSGHPISLKFDPQLEALGATFTQGSASGLDYRFSMQGRDVTIRAYDLGGSSVDDESILYFVLPVKALQIETARMTVLNGTATDGIVFVNNALIGSPIDPANIYGVIFKTVTETGFASGSANHQGRFSYTSGIEVDEE